MEKTRNNMNFTQLLMLTKRHLKVFFNNKMRVFYTLLVPIIIFAVYVFFLRSLELNSVQSALAEAFENNSAVLNDQFLMKQISGVVDSWMLSGIVSLSTLTVSLQTNNIFVEDKEDGINRDFISSPINQNVLIGSYFLFNFIVTFTTCLLVSLLTLIYLGATGEFFLTFLDFIYVIGALLIGTITSTLTTIFICLFIKKEGTLSSIIAIGATAAGFLIGAYMPITMLPKWVQNACAFFPGTYTTSIIRNAYSTTLFGDIKDYLLSMNYLSQAEAADFVLQLKNGVGYNISFFNIDVEIYYQILTVVIFILIFVVLNVFFAKEMTRITDGVVKIKKDTRKIKEKITGENKK